MSIGFNQEEISNSRLLVNGNRDFNRAEKWLTLSGGREISVTPIGERENYTISAKKEPTSKWTFGNFFKIVKWVVTFPYTLYLSHTHNKERQRVISQIVQSAPGNTTSTTHAVGAGTLQRTNVNQPEYGTFQETTQEKEEARKARAQAERHFIQESLPGLNRETISTQSAIVDLGLTSESSKITNALESLEPAMTTLTDRTSELHSKHQQVKLALGESIHYSTSYLLSNSGLKTDFKTLVDKEAILPDVKDALKTLQEVKSKIPRFRTDVSDLKHYQRNYNTIKSKVETLRAQCPKYEENIPGNLKELLETFDQLPDLSHIDVAAYEETFNRAEAQISKFEEFIQSTEGEIQARDEEKARQAAKEAEELRIQEEKKEQEAIRAQAKAEKAELTAAKKPFKQQKLELTLTLKELTKSLKSLTSSHDLGRVEHNITMHRKGCLQETIKRFLPEDKVTELEMIIKALEAEQKPTHEIEKAKAKFYDTLFRAELHETDQVKRGWRQSKETKARNAIITAREAYLKDLRTFNEYKTKLAEIEQMLTPAEKLVKTYTKAYAAIKSKADIDADSLTQKYTSAKRQLEAMQTALRSLEA